MLNSPYYYIGLNSKFERAFVLVLENISGPSAVTHYNSNSTAYYHHYSQQWSKANRFEYLVVGVVRGWSPRVTI